MNAAIAQTSLRRSLVVQCRVIHALLLREVITRYGRQGLGVLWLVLEPALFTLGVSALWYFGRLHTASSVPIVAFAVTGYSSVLMWRNSASRCAKAIEPNLSLMYHRNVKVIDIFVSRVCLELIGATASMVLLTIVFCSLDAMQWPVDLGRVVQGWLMLGWFALAIGMLVGAASERSETLERTWHIMSYLLFPLSGALFMVHWLPPVAQDLVLWFPMVHGVEMIRQGYFGEVVPTHANITYFATMNLAMSLLALALVRESGRRVQPE